MALFQEESLWSEVKWILYLPSIHFFFLDLIIFHVHPSKKSKVTRVLCWFLLERVVSTWHIQVWISLVGVLFASYLKWLNFPIQRLGVLPIMLWTKKKADQWNETRYVLTTYNETNFSARIADLWSKVHSLCDLRLKTFLRFFFNLHGTQH